MELNPDNPKLDAAISITQPLVRWLIQNGIGYSDFTTALKQSYFEQAVLENNAIQGKPTDSAISLLSGLHRKDVKLLREHDIYEIKKKPPVSIANQVTTTWLQHLQGKTISISPEFDDLVKQVTMDVHPRTVLNELERIGIIHIHEEEVSLIHQAFTPSPDSLEILQLFAENVADHLLAATANISRTSSLSHLEQSVFCDELSPESIEQLRQTSHELWKELSFKILDQAEKLYQQDRGKAEAIYRFKLGVYNFYEQQLSQKLSLEEK